MDKGYIIADRYICERPLGNGSFGSVFLVFDIKLGKYWAAKQCPIRSDMETQALKTVDMKAFPRITDTVDQDGFLYLIMDYVEGTPLSRYCSMHAVKEPDIINWMLQVAHAIDYLHNLTPPLLYMDCKPANIMLTSSMEIRLVDLGSVYEYDSAYSGAISSTRFYAPTEVTSHDSSSSIGIYSDVYSFGMTMYRLLTGSNTEYRDSKGFLRPEYINKHISHKSADIIRKCTVRTSTLRYQSMKDIIHDLESASILNKRHFGSIFRLKIKSSVCKCLLSIGTIISALKLSEDPGNTSYICLTSALFLLLIRLCLRPVCYSWETRKSIMRCD